MTCPHCAFENPPAMAFCGRCGTRLASLCPSCGFANPEGFAFCGKCGTRVEEVAAPPRQSAPAFASPQSYTPKHLAEKILTSKAALEGERKQVTVLFADLKGSMELLADRDPEEARKVLDPVLERMMEAVHRYEGTVNQVMGDGIMALFGAPLAHEDHAVRACFAALRMQDAVKRYAEGVRREHGLTLRIRVGLNSGEVVVRAIGSDLHMDYTAVGQTTHLAARMEQLADPGSILLTTETLALAEGFIQVAALGPMAVRGLPGPVEVYELTGVSAIRSRLQATATRGLSPFVGRDAEMEQLRRALEQARQGRGQVAAIVGAPGVGKSRLVFELTHSHRVEGWLVLEAGSVSYGKATSYLPVIDLLKGYFRIADRDTYRDIREKVTGRLLTLDRALELVLPALVALLDVPVEDPQWQGLDPPQRRQRTLDAVKLLLLREAQNQPLLVIFEDLHWIDSETQVFLDTLVASLPTVRLLFLVNYRTEYTHGWGSKTFYTQLRLDTLPAESAGALLDALLGPDASLASLKILLSAKTGGNPFFLEESVRTLAETHILLGARGAYRLAQPIEAVQVPATVQAILAARIDRLPSAEKRLLETAAVIGKDVPLLLLEAINDEPDDRLRRQLAALQGAEFLYETRLFPSHEYTFKHALTHEVAYQGLLHDRRRALHARITEALERLAPERVAEQAERLAHHALRGELWEKAVEYLHQAGLRALARGALREAIAHLEQTLGVLRRLPETRQTIELAIDIHLDIRNALEGVDWARMAEPLQEAEVLARALGDQHRLARIATFMADQCVNTGDFNKGVRFGQEALSLARTLDDRGTEVIATTLLGLLHTFRGEFSDAATLFERNIVALEGNLRYERFGTAFIQAAFSRSTLSDGLSQLGRFDEAIEHGEGAVRIAEAADHPLSLFPGLMSLGLAHLRRGDLPRATPILERSLDLSRTWQFVTRTPLATAALGVAYVLAGRAEEALPLMADVVEEFGRPPGSHMRPAIALLSAGTAYLSAGRIDVASTHAREALALSRRLGARGSEAHALCLLGDVASACLAEDAEGYYREARALATELGMRPLIAHCHLGLGTLYRRTGDSAKAHEHFATSTAMYREMGMGFWLEQAEAAMSALR